MRSFLVTVGLVWAAAAACGSVGEQPDICPIGQLDCDGVCIDALNNNLNCGACGNACEPGLVCGNGECALTCPGEQSECTGTCVDTDTNLENCGECGNACESNQECRAGLCETPCAEGLVGQADADSWGLTWDGFARTAADLGAARDECAGFGGRLPTATEVYRASIAHGGTIGEAFETDPLWTQVPADESKQITSRLSDGAATETIAINDAAFRCVCAPPPPPFFDAQRCNGPASESCKPIDGVRNIDAVDRPALRLSSALWECANELAHLADTTTLKEAPLAGVPGSNAFLMTSDRWSYDRQATVRWSGTTPWTASYGAGATDTHYFVYETTGTPGALPFRCVGPRTAVGVHPNAVAGAFVPATTGYTLDGADRPAMTWPESHDACTEAGGHLARASEIAEGLYLGLGGGSGTNIRTADSCGYQTDAQFRVSTMRWTGTAARFSHVYNGNAGTTPISWEYKHTNDSPFRCVYYPIDETITEPATCSSGCFTMALPGATPATMWFDSTDRAAATFASAIADCRDEGGHLASERDLTEAIRGGLPNGTNAFVWAADNGQGQSMVVGWTAVQTDFTDLWGPFMTWDHMTASRAYRCMWTNEVR